MRTQDGNSLFSGLALYFLLRSVKSLRGVPRTLAQAIAASAVMGAAVLITAGLFSAGESLVSKALAVLIPSAAGLLVYAAVLILSGADDLRLLRRLLSRRAGRPKKS